LFKGTAALVRITQASGVYRQIKHKGILYMGVGKQQRVVDKLDKLYPVREEQ